MSEHSAPAEQIALEEVSLVLHEIVDALLEAEGREWPPPGEGQRDGRDGASSKDGGDA